MWGLWRFVGLWGRARKRLHIRWNFSFLRRVRSMWELVGVVGVWEQIVGDKASRTTLCFRGSLLLSLGFLAGLTKSSAVSRARGTGPDLRGALGRPGAMMDDPPMGRQLRGLSETRQQFGEYIRPLGSVLSPKNLKRTPNIKKASLEKIQNPPSKNVCRQIGGVALDQTTIRFKAALGRLIAGKFSAVARDRHGERVR